MLTNTSFDYAVLRLVPRVERQEFVNIGVIVFCLEKQFLQAKVYLDQTRVKALWPHLDIDMARRHAEAIVRICSGDTSAGPIALLSKKERFHWLVSPRSTMIQTSDVHTGLCEETDDLVDRLFRQLVRDS